MELTASEDADCRDSLPLISASSCSPMLKEGMPDEVAPDTGFRLRDWVRLSLLERLVRLVSKELSGRPVEACEACEASLGTGGKALVGGGGTASAIAIVSSEAGSEGAQGRGRYIWQLP
jgi:hypothetical protein